MTGLNEGRSYRRQLFDEIFNFSEDDSLFAEDVEEDESAGDQDMNKGGIGAVANTNAIEEGPLTGMLFPCISTMFNFYKEHARLKEEIKRMWYCHVIQPTEEGRREADNEPGIERHKIMEKSIINNWFRREFVYDVEYRKMANISAAIARNSNQKEYCVAIS
ncbi:hypothetical protein GH714_016644 [Hevea brasiliensis]|uniref:Uncharacterized protein n=1 Tax=Hevea brasiliensis TaxID=3981 RepID=A0A6A6L0D9_HEVBR|nr:hypothetical protein GH714_016644 [Hevea brasiliensis]